MKTGPSIYVTIRADVALVRGIEAERVAHMVTPQNDQPRWSKMARGWVIGSEYVADLLAYAQQYRLLAVLSDVTDLPKRTAS